MDALESPSHIKEEDERRWALVVSCDLALNLLYLPRSKRLDPPAIGGGRPLGRARHSTAIGGDSLALSPRETLRSCEHRDDSGVSRHVHTFWEGAYL
eukprot:315864-Alexandrium_andersonii.AAC.1